MTPDRAAAILDFLAIADRLKQDSGILVRTEGRTSATGS